MISLLNQIKEKIIILLKSFNSLYFFFDRFFTENSNINIIYPKLDGDPNNLVNWSEGTKTVPSLKNLIQYSLQQYPYNIIIPRLEKVSKGIMQTQIYLIRSDFDGNLSIFPYTYSDKKYFEFNNTDNIYLIRLFADDSNRNKIVPIFIPYRLYEEDINAIIFKTVFPIIPKYIINTGGIYYAYLFIDDIYPATIIHDVYTPKKENYENSNRKIIGNPIIWFDKDTNKKFVFKNYTNSLIDCDINNENNLFKLIIDEELNKYIKDPLYSNQFPYKKEYLLRDIELGFRKVFFPIQDYDGIVTNTYVGNTIVYIEDRINNTSFYYDLYSPVLLINNNRNIEYVKSKVKIYELHLTKVNLITISGTSCYRPSLTYRYIPTIFPFIFNGSQIIKNIGYTVENSVEYISSLQSWKSSYDNDNNGLINFESNISTYIPNSGCEIIYYHINRIQKNTSSKEVIYGILMIINSIPILYAPYLKLKGDGYFYNVIYNPNDINMVKQRIRYEETKFFPIFYNGYKLLNDQEYTLYGKRYPYNKSFFSFAPFFGYEYNYNSRKYLVPILLREYSLFGYQLNESDFKNWNAGFFTGEFLNDYHDIPDENMMFSVFNLNNVTNPNDSNKNLAYRLLGTLVLLVNGDDWIYNDTGSSPNVELPVPAIRGYVEFYKNAATPILEKIDDSI